MGSDWVPACPLRKHGHLQNRRPISHTFFLAMDFCGTKVKKIACSAQNCRVSLFHFYSKVLLVCLPPLLTCCTVTLCCTTIMVACFFQSDCSVFYARSWRNMWAYQKRDQISSEFAWTGW